MTESYRFLKLTMSAMRLLAKEVESIHREKNGSISIKNTLSEWHDTFLKVLLSLLIIGLANQRRLLSSDLCVQIDSMWFGILKGKEYSWGEIQHWMHEAHGEDSIQLSLIDSAMWTRLRDPVYQALPMGQVLLLIQTVLNGLDAEHTIFGSLYEQMLQVVPEWDDENDQYTVSVQPENLRKSTGAFYTPQPLVKVILSSTIKPLVQRFAKSADPFDILRDITICDPACGLGHILIAAAKYLANEVAQIYPSASVEILCHFILRHCVYGVDINPLTVDVCKVCLWFETRDPTLSMTTWDDKIRCGNSLLGVTPKLIEQGITEASFVRVLHHDDRLIRRKIALKSRRERRLFNPLKVNDVQVSPLVLADTLIASMVWPKIVDGDWYAAAPTFQVFEQMRQGKIDPLVMELVQRLRVKHRFFHWHLEFPIIMENGGFDVVIGNPPFLDSELLKKTVPYERIAIANLYESAKGNWDVFIPFTELGLRIVKANGFQAFVTPNKIIGSDYAASLQKTCLLTNSIREIHDFSKLFLFEKVRVTVVVVVTQKSSAKDSDIVHFYQYDHSPPQVNLHRQSTIGELKTLPPGYLSFPVTSIQPPQLNWMSKPNRLSDCAQVSDGSSTAEAYLIRDVIQHGKAEDWCADDWIALINTGTIDPYYLQWGQKNIRYLGVQSQYPVVHCSDLIRIANKRYLQSLKPSVVVAGMASCLEAAVAPARVMCGKSAVLIQPQAGICPYALTALLNSTAINNLYTGLFAMRALNSQAINIGPRQLELLPMPSLNFLQTFIGEVTADNLADQIGESETTLSYLGQLLHRIVSNEQKERAKQRIEVMISNIMNQ